MLFFFLILFPTPFRLLHLPYLFFAVVAIEEKEPCGVLQDISTSGLGRYKQASVRIDFQILAGNRRCDGAYWIVKI